MDADQAGRIGRERAEKLYGQTGDEIVSKAMQPGEQPQAPQRINLGDFAASVESAGASEQKKLVSLSEAIKDNLVELVRQGRVAPRLGP